MSAAEHDRRAAHESQLADQDAQHYDPHAAVRQIECAGRGACWTSLRNPTDEHRRAAEAHRRAAADHRAASLALRDAEASTCSGIAADDRDTSPFDHREDIAAVDSLIEFRAIGKQQIHRRTGAIVTFRAVPGMTAEWLQRLVDCHAARNAALGHVVPEMPDCPLVLRGVAARVHSVGNGFAVELRADDPQVADEILARARRLR